MQADGFGVTADVVMALETGSGPKRDRATAGSGSLTAGPTRGMCCPGHPISGQHYRRPGEIITEGTRSGGHGDLRE